MEGATVSSKHNVPSKRLGTGLIKPHMGSGSIRLDGFFTTKKKYTYVRRNASTPCEGIWRMDFLSLKAEKGLARKDLR